MDILIVLILLAVAVVSLIPDAEARRRAKVAKYIQDQFPGGSK